MDLAVQKARRDLDKEDPESYHRYLCALQRTDQRKLFGVSLGGCVQAVLDGYVSISEVVGISANTTGFVEDAKPGPNFQLIVEQYQQSYWRVRRYKTDHLMEVIHALLPVVSERKKGVPDTWIDATQPYGWGNVPQYQGEGYIGYYVDPKTNSLLLTPHQIQERVSLHHRINP